MTIAAALLTITVRVYDIYGLPAAERHEAIETAGRIMAQAGIEAQFIECQPPLPEPCEVTLKPRELVLRITPDAPPRHEVLGTAVVSPTGGPSVMATVFGNAVLEGAARNNVRLGTLAGRVAAHEIGHLLLGANSHSLHGLMRPKWDVTRAGADDWLFSSVDADTIRHKLAALAATRSAVAIGDVFEAPGDGRAPDGPKTNPRG